MKNYKVSKEMQSEAERMVIAIALGGSLELFEKLAEKLADKYAKDNSPDERAQVKEYLRRKVVNTEIDTTLGGGIIIGNAAATLGSMTSDKKARAARRNGKKGGRPAKKK